jgi:signal peptidase II
MLNQGRSLLWRWYVLSLVVIGVDQITKYLIINALALYQSLPVLPFFNLTLAYNKGAAFSFLSGSGDAATWLFAGISSVVSLIIIITIYKLPAAKRWLAFALALILGGALSNLIDRLLHGYVIDFLDFYYENWHFAIFNIADAAITVGAVIWFWEVLFLNKQAAAVKTRSGGKH